MRAIVIALLTIILAYSGTSQVFRRNDAKLDIDNSKGIILVYSPLKGDLYLNGMIMTTVTENDTVYIVNLEPGSYSAQLKGDGFESEQVNCPVEKSRITELTLSKEFPFVKIDTKAYARTAEIIAGKPVMFVRDKALYLNVSRGLI